MADPPPNPYWTVEIDIDGPPKAAPRGRTTRTGRTGRGTRHRTRVYNPGWYTAHKQQHATHIRNTIPPHTTQQLPLTGPLQLKIVYTFPIADPHKWGRPRPCTPDIDNLLKTTLDTLTLAAVWEDDRQVTELKTRKRWGQHGHTSIKIRPTPTPTNT